MIKDGRQRAETVGGLLDLLDETATGSPRVSVGDIVERVGERGFGPLLLLPVLFEISPIGGIPTLPTMLASIIVLVAAQLAIGRDRLWLPGFLQRRAIGAGRLKTAIRHVRPVAAWMDRWFHGRMPLLVSRRFVLGGALIAILACLTVPFVELFPFASTIPMAVVIAFSLAITVRDDLLLGRSGRRLRALVAFDPVGAAPSGASVPIASARHDAATTDRMLGLSSCQPFA